MWKKVKVIGTKYLCFQKSTKKINIYLFLFRADDTQKDVTPYEKVTEYCYRKNSKFETFLL